MSFPEKFTGDPIIINDYCAILFIPQSRSSCIINVCSTSSRRIKVNVDFTLCSRYCLFFPVVGTLYKESMKAEVTISPYRVRTLGVMEPEKGTVLISHKIIMTQLQYIVNVFIEDDKGVMIPVIKWKDNIKRDLNISSSNSTTSSFLKFTSTTLLDAWPSWLLNIKAEEFIVTKREESIVFTNKENNSKNDIYLYVDEILDGVAYLITVLNNCNLPYHVIYKLCWYNNNNNNNNNNDKSNNTNEENNSLFFFVPMDGIICKESLSISGYVPGEGGDIALGWIIRNYNNNNNNNNESLLSSSLTSSQTQKFPSHLFTAIPCDPNPIVPSLIYSKSRLTSQTKRINNTVVQRIIFKNKKNRNFFSNVKNLSKSLPKSASPSKSNRNSTQMNPTLCQTSIIKSNYSPQYTCNSLYSSDSSKVNKSKTKEGSMKSLEKDDLDQNIQENLSTELFSSDKDSPLNYKIPLLENSILVNESMEEAEKLLNEENSKEKEKEFEMKKNILFQNYNDSIRNLEIQYLKEIQKGLISMEFNFTGKIESEIENNINILKDQNSIKYLQFKNIENSSSNLTKENFNNKSVNIVSIQQAMRRIESKEVLERISIETYEIIEWKFFILERQQSPCLFCKKSILPWSLVVEEPIEGNKVHFSCYKEIRKKLQESNDEVNSFTSNIVNERVHSVESIF